MDLGAFHENRIQSDILVLPDFGHGIGFIICTPRRFYKSRVTWDISFGFIVNDPMVCVGVAHVSFFI